MYVQIISQFFYGASSIVLKGYSSTAQNIVAVFRNLAAAKNIRLYFTMHGRRILLLPVL